MWSNVFIKEILAHHIGVPDPWNGAAALMLWRVYFIYAVMWRQGRSFKDTVSLTKPPIKYVSWHVTRSGAEVSYLKERMIMEVSIER